MSVSALVFFTHWLRRRQGWGNQKSRVWLRLFRAGETVQDGLGIASHESKEVNVIVSLPETRANDIIQVATSASKHTVWRYKSFCGNIRESSFCRVGRGRFYESLH